MAAHFNTTKKQTSSIDKGKPRKAQQLKTEGREFNTKQNELIKLADISELGRNTV